MAEVIDLTQCSDDSGDHNPSAARANLLGATATAFACLLTGSDRAQQPGNGVPVKAEPGPVVDGFQPPQQQQQQEQLQQAEPMDIEDAGHAEPPPQQQPAAGPSQPAPPAPGASSAVPFSAQVRASQRAKRPARPKSHMAGELAEAPQHLSRPLGSRGVVALAAMETMQAHLEQLPLGLRPSDPTVTDLPDELPLPLRPIPEHAEVIRLSECTQAQLIAVAKSTERTDVFTALLPEPPGIPPGRRIGHFTGQQGRADRPGAQSGLGAAAAAAARLVESGPPDFSNPLMVELHECVTARRQVPWEMLGRSGAPVIGGKELQALELWELVRREGGSEAVTAGKKWAKVARLLEVDQDRRIKQAGYLVKSHFTKYLHPYETWLWQGGGRHGAAAANGGGVDKRSNGAVL